MKDDCVFCREIGGSKDTNFAVRYPEMKSRILHETKSLLAFPCIGQLAKGHFLIIPKVHDCTFRQIYRRLNSLKEELREQISRVHEILGMKPESSLFFEHGALDEKNGGCGIYHAHIHVVPNVSFILPKEVFNFSKQKRSPDIISSLDQLSSDVSYVLAGSVRSGFYSEPIEFHLPSQTLRKNVACQLGNSNWDWRNVFREEWLISILKEANATSLLWK